MSVPSKVRLLAVMVLEGELARVRAVEYSGVT
jgi:hypothetical protein